MEPLESREMPATFLVTSVADSGPGTLRQAIISANTTPGTDAIHFNTPGANFPTFRPTSPLPSITDPVVIDGRTEPGYVNRPVITLDGSLAGANANGLTLLAGQSTVQGMIIQNFDGYGMVLSGGGGNQILGNYVGVDATGGTAMPNRAGGLLLLGSSNNAIGIGQPGGGNVISGNGGDGIRIVGPTTGLTDQVATGNQILSNFLGIDSTGTTKVANAGDGIHLIRASANAIGATSFGFGNIISGNVGNGIQIEGDGGTTINSGSFNLVQGNLIGVARNSTTGFGNGRDGVLITTSANSIGGTVAGAGNVISNNAGNGVTATGTGISVLSNTIAGNGGVGLVTSGSTTPAPVLDSIIRNGTSATVSGRIVGLPATAYAIQFFGDLAGESQARNYLGYSVQTTDATGQAAFLLTIPTGVPLGGVVTATATGPNDETSPISQPTTAPAAVSQIILAPNGKTLTVQFDQPMNTASLMDRRNYRVSTTKAIAISAIQVSADGLSAQLILSKKVPKGMFATLLIDPAGAPGITTARGVPLDGNRDGTAGGTYRGRVAVGPTVAYNDSSGHKVTLKLAKGGVLSVSLNSSNNAQVVTLVGALAGRSVLSGTVKGKNARARIELLVGVGGATNRLTNPPFVIGTIA